MQKFDAKGLDMAVLTLAEARRRLQLFRDAEEAILLNNQEYTIGDRTFKRADLRVIAQRIAHYESEVERLEAGNSRGIVLRRTATYF